MQPVLSIDLSSKEVKHFDIPEDWQQAYLGGASLAARMLFDALTTGVKPNALEAPLLFLTGPLTGTAGPAVGRFVVCARSPATGLWGESNCGGFWGPELRKAGYDGLLVTGKSEQLVYIWIKDGEVEIRSAHHLQGLDTYQTQTAVSVEINCTNPRIAVIGPAGERGFPMALILTDHGRVAGRTGMGAVMGSKNLKAIAVKGSGKVPYSNPVYSQLRSAVNRQLKDDNMSKTAREVGTSGVADYLDYLGEMPKKYFQSGIFDGVYNTTGATMAETILTGVKACHACVIACGREVQLLGETKTQKGPEYETMVGFGPNLCIDDLAFVTRMNEKSDRLGVDTISLTNTLGLAFTLYEYGYINDADTDGLALRWGDKNAVEQLMKKMIIGEDFGVILMEGARALAKRYGVEELAVQVNGLEVPYHDPRGGSGTALSYAMSPRGACHNQSDYFLVDVYGQVEEDLGMLRYERYSGAEKVSNIVIHQNWRTVFNALVMCYFANISPETLLNLIVAATGCEYSLSDLLQVGERSWNLKRVINNKLGLTSENDRLPKLLRKPYAEGGSAGYKVPFEEMKTSYYQARGWDPNTGVPSKAKLKELGLEWVHEENGCE